MVKGGTTTVKPRKNSPVRIIEQDENLDIFSDRIIAESRWFNICRPTL
jgi:hypothetical protein